MRGRKPTAPQLKVIAGTDRPDRRNTEAPQFDVLQSFPPAPGCLNAVGAAMWNELGPQLVAVSVLQVVDLYMLELACYSWQRYRAKAEAGSDILAAESTALKGLFSEFGMSPAARRKVTSSGDAKKENRFAANGKRSA